MPSSSYVQGDVIDVTCGQLTGKLHKNKFYCPGIHRECIEQPDGKFISPKMFTIMGEKERLKDWKNAVRIHGLQLRRYIDSGQLDFYRHEEYCTGRCVARTPISSTPGEKVSTASTTNRRRSLTVSPFIPPDFPVEKKLVRSPVPKVEFVGSINEHTYCHLPDDSERLAPEEQVDVKPDMTVLQNFLKRSTASFSKPSSTEASTSNDKNEENKDVAVGLDDKPLATDQLNIPIEFSSINTADSSYKDDKNFWTGIIEFGFLDVFLVDIKDHINILRKNLVTGGLPEDCYKMSVIVRVLGLMDKFKKKMATYKLSMEKQEAKLEKEMEELKTQVAIFERRKEALKKKSEKFKSLLQINTEYKADPNSSAEGSSNKTSSIVSSTVSLVPRQGQVQPVVLKTNSEVEGLKIIQTTSNASNSLLRNKSFVKKVLLTSVPSDQKNDLKQVTVTIARLKECLEGNKKVPVAQVVDVNSAMEGVTPTVMEKSVYVPPQAATSEEVIADTELETDVVDTTSDNLNKDGVPISTEVVSSSPEFTATANTSTESEKSSSSSMTTTSLAQLVAEKLDGRFYIDGKPRMKRIKLNSTFQKTNTAVKDKLRDRLKTGPPVVEDGEGETSKQTGFTCDDTSDNDSNDTSSEAKRRKAEESTDENQKELVDKETRIPFYGVKRKTITEIIVSKEIAESTKHILRGANEIIPGNVPKTVKRDSECDISKQTESTCDGTSDNDSTDTSSEAKRRKTEESTDENQKELVDKVTGIPYYGVKRKTVTEIIVSKEVAEKTKHILRGANEIMYENIPKTVKNVIDSGVKVEKQKVTVKKSVERKDEKDHVFEVKSENGNVGSKTEISCQTPLDGIREKVIDSSVVASRRSSRKTPHLFTWGSKTDIVKKVL
ncbi:uncharacterized protein LOC121377394 [Gigantopelta aegis]|uniref:uncharacterized protein LOC121377394 n=1 Tax=Gigantopelta aegis TaxID=1735272 RepID=UPI001B88BEDA|nr:uncharacterized protein LOC121377394 [Gigantopelta aegis]